MCGIAGVFGGNSQDIKKQVEEMTKALVHRGPDAGNVVDLENIVLGHRRLSIIDLDEKSNQPLSDHSRRFWIVFNGEIYNFKTLRRDLEEKGAVFKTQSDTEVVLEAWKHWGEGALQKFIGMFAFALWDSEEKALFLVRDRMGEKPLYYFPLNNFDEGVAFSSELTSLIKCKAVSRELNPEALLQYFSYNYILTNQSIFKGVKKLPPAHYMKIQKGRKPLVREYWSLKDCFLNKKTYLSFEEAKETLNELLQEAVNLQTVSDVPLGAFLSGGIDSATIVSKCVNHLHTDNVHTFSIGFNQKSFDELPESIQTADFLQVQHHTKVVDFNVKDVIEKIITSFDEPFADTSMVPTYFLSEFSRQKITVALSGDGGDELFLGYPTYLADRLYQYISKVPKPLLGMVSMASQFMPTSFNKVSLDYKIKKFLEGAGYDFPNAHCSWRSIFSKKELPLLLRDSHQDLLKGTVSDQTVFFKDVAECHYLDQASYVDMKTWLVDDILVKVDRMSMRHSLETRAPFLDHRLVEFAAGLPHEWKLKGSKKKHLLRESQRGTLSNEILDRAKKGFSSPVSHWIQTHLKEFSHDMIHSSVLKEWVEKKYVNKIWEEHQKSQKDHGLKLFGLACLGHWLNNNKIN